MNLIIAYVLDKLLGDPENWPHPIIWFGQIISKAEQRFNQGSNRRNKGAWVAVILILGTYIIARTIITRAYYINFYLGSTLSIIGIFYSLAGKTLCDEVRNVFLATERSLDQGRKQLSRIVGRDTTQLSAQEIRTAALETLSENLSDGVIAPLFWYAILGVPGMLAYKMINTLDSMIGYKTERYGDFGYLAAKIDDVANYLPARLTALLIILCGGFNTELLTFVRKYGPAHASPNSGYPEAALAGVLDCRFGGTHTYFGQVFEKPYIGSNERPITSQDMLTAIGINQRAELIMVILIVSIQYLTTHNYIL